MINEVKFNGELYAIILSHRFDKAGLHFLTPNEFTQQLAYIHHPAGKVIQPHIHNPIPRTVEYSCEVLFVKKGRVRVDFFDNQQLYLESRILETNDTILLMKGGHGFEALDDLEMIEAKQGPYAGEKDKVKFTASLPKELKYGSDKF